MHHSKKTNLLKKFPLLNKLAINEISIHLIVNFLRKVTTVVVLNDVDGDKRIDIKMIQTL